MAEYPAAASALSVQPQAAQAEAFSGAQDARTPASVQSGRRLNRQDMCMFPFAVANPCAGRVRRTVGRLRKWARDADEGLLQAKRGGPRGCWTRTSPTLRWSGSAWVMTRSRAEGRRWRTRTSPFIFDARAESRKGHI